LATSDKTTIVVERQPDGKMRVTSGSWDGEKVFLKDRVLKLRHAIADARLQVARETKAPDDWDPPYESYDPYGLGGVTSPSLARGSSPRRPIGGGEICGIGPGAADAVAAVRKHDRCAIERLQHRLVEVRHAVPDARLKMRVTSGSWDGEKIIFRDQVLEVRHAVPDARLHVARKTKADSLVKR
jgi:hypothetical protein